MYNPNPTPVKPKIVPEAEASENPDRLPEMETGDDLGSFTGFLRRAKASASGLTALIFGENGTDADVITSFHLTRFLDALVHVVVWQVKDASGRIMRENGAYPKLVEFDARIKRPIATNFGQTAQFFGENGPNADAINILNQTRYLDALVHVQMTKADPGFTPAAVQQTPLEELDEAAQRRTPKEMKELKEQQRRAADAQRLLHQGGFYRSEAVWRALGSVFEFQDWITIQPCCHPGTAPCDGSPVVAHAIPGQKGYALVPFCREHENVWTNGTPDLNGQNPLEFLKLRQQNLVQRWAKDRLRRALRVPDGFDPTPSSIYAWAVEQRLQTSLPSGFMALI